MFNTSYPYCGKTKTKQNQFCMSKEQAQRGWTRVATTDKRNMNIPHFFPFIIACNFLVPSQDVQSHSRKCAPAPSFSQAWAANWAVCRDRRASAGSPWKRAGCSDTHSQSHATTAAGCLAANWTTLIYQKATTMKWFKIKKRRGNSDSSNLLLGHSLKYFYHWLTWPLQRLLN